MDQLFATADAIEQQLNLANQLSSTLHSYGHSTSIVEDGVTDAAIINQQMVTAYNDAIDAVLTTQYKTASEVMMDNHITAINNLHTAINDLVSATSVLATVTTVADMAASADTTQEQLQVQAALATTDMSITQADVNNYNTALGDVNKFATEAGAFLAAANNTSITGAIDSFAATSGVAVAAYTAVSYSQSIDQMIITWDAGTYMSFAGYNAGNTVTADEIYANVGYVGG